MAERVFVDANIFISSGKLPGGPVMRRFSELVSAGLIELVTTDHTIKEISRKFAETDFDAVKDIARGHVRAILKSAINVELPKIDKPTLRQRIREQYDADVSKFMKELQAKIIPVDTVKPSVVLTAYSNATGFFAEHGKRDQFPDAFIFEALKQAFVEKKSLIIISNDGDFAGPIKNEEAFTHITSIPDLFSHLGLAFEAPEVDKILDTLNEKILPLASQEAIDWGLHAYDVEEAHVEVEELTAAEISDYSVFGPVDDDGEYLIVGTLMATAKVRYEHPDWEGGIYDREDDRIYTFEDVDGEKELEVEPGFEMTVWKNNETSEYEILSFKFRGNWNYVELHPYDPYEFN